MTTAGEAALPSEEVLEARARDLFAAWGVLDRLAHVEVVWNSRLRTTAGRAFMRRLQIELNPRLLARVPERVEEVLTHEAAHLATCLLHGRRAAQHGPEWRRLMEQAGFAPDTTHDFPVDGLQPRRSWFLHVCRTCGARAIVDHTRAPRPCGCDPAAVRIFRAARTPAGRQRLEALDGF